MFSKSPCRDLVRTFVPVAFSLSDFVPISTPIYWFERTNCLIYRHGVLLYDQCLNFPFVMNLWFAISWQKIALERYFGERLISLSKNKIKWKYPQNFNWMLRIKLQDSSIRNSSHWFENTDYPFFKIPRKHIALGKIKLRVTINKYLGRN